MLSMLLAYDDEGNVIATLDYLTARDTAGNVIGLVDFDAHERAGGFMTDVWTVDGAKGSKVWPEWLGAQAHDFRVELVGPSGDKRIGALIHKTSGHRRERATIEGAISERIASSRGPVDIRDLVGGPDRPIKLDGLGRTAIRGEAKSSHDTTRANTVPVVRMSPRNRRLDSR